MGIELWWLFTITIAYLGVLFLVAYLADSGMLPAKLIAHPVVYSLSLGVYATSWTYYGSVGLADRSGYAFLTVYLGVTGAFLLGPYILKPILTLCQEYQLTSIADLLAFRYGGRGTGLVVTVFMLIGILPYISLQIRAVTESLQILSKQVPPDVLALIFCLIITVFAILFGARHLSPREKHHGLVIAIAFESAIKLIALLIAGFFVISNVFDSPAGLQNWLEKNPEQVSNLYAPSNSGLWSTMLLISFCAAFLLPRQYHMTFVENENPRNLNTAYWLFPLYLLLLNLPIIPILFAGRYLNLDIPPDFYVLGISLSLGKEWLAIIVFLGGLSAASAMMIVTTLALSYMCLNHLLLPAALFGKQPKNFYHRLIWSKRIIIALIIAAGYGFSIYIELHSGLASLGLISFVAAAQLLPGVVGLLFWTRATQIGFLAGLLGGAVVWFLLLILPLIWPLVDLLPLIGVNTDIWTLSTFCSLSTNSLLFIICSLLSKPSLDELTAIEAVQERTSFALSGPYTARSAKHYHYAMQETLGNKVAEQEMLRALQETGLDMAETRPAELRLLHERLERNISGLVGPILARTIVRNKRPHSTVGAASKTPGTRLLEMRLEASREQMRGLTKQLDDLRRYLRDVLHKLPLAACSISGDERIYIWNSAMQQLTGIDERSARDSKLEQLPSPWSHLLSDFASSDEYLRFRCPVNNLDRSVSVNLHKADIGTPTDTDHALAGQVILMEDRTAFDTLEAELAHSERLASVGRLAAGVAHEIGNPLTGIASLAQNLAQDAKDDAFHENGAELVSEQAADILNQVSRINSIVRSLLTFSHAENTQQASQDPVNITECVNEALRLVRLSPDTRQFKFDIDLTSNAVVLGDSNQLMQVFVNLINNACDASSAGNRIKIDSIDELNTVSIIVTDEGDGIDSTIREKIFEPFFTTKAVGSGTGLGLSLVYSLVTKHEGRIRVENANPQGTRMIVTLPLRPSST